MLYEVITQRGEMTREQMSMQNIMAWARQHPDRVADLLAENPRITSYNVCYTKLLRDILALIDQQLDPGRGKMAA